MTQQICQTRSSERGFTLVELAIVMIIIGLLIGGVLKGQELISNAKTTATVAQAKSFSAGISTFQDQYASLPGDIASPSTRLPNCTAAICAAVGDADTLIETGTSGDPGALTAAIASTEATRSFLHLSAAGIISGPDVSITAITAAEALPEAKVGGRWVIGSSTGAITNKTGTAAANAGVYALATLGGVAPLATAGTGVMSPKVASIIDTKLDDGQPNLGSVRALGGASGTTCASAATAVGVYNTSLAAHHCSIAAEVQ